MDSMKEMLQKASVQLDELRSIKAVTKITKEEFAALAEMKDASNPSNTMQAQSTALRKALAAHKESASQMERMIKMAQAVQQEFKSIDAMKEALSLASKDLGVTETMQVPSVFSLIETRSSHEPILATANRLLREKYRS